MSGNQAADPVNVMKAVMKAVVSGAPPHRLLLGNAAYEGAMEKLAALTGEFTALEAVSRSADFPAAEQGNAA